MILVQKILSLLITFILVSPLIAMAETEPEPEYPYPKKKEATLDIEKPKMIGPDGSYYYGDDKPSKHSDVLEGVEAPSQMGPDGSYYYGNKKDTEIKSLDGVERPTEKKKDGSYIYDTKNKRQQKIYGEKPDKILDDGTYLYNSKPKVVNNVLYIRGGLYGPPNIKSATSNLTYKDIYPNRASFVFNLEYDWRLGSTFFFKVGTGVTSAQGKGQFASGANPGLTPRESFQYYIFPTTASIAYKFQLWDIQYLTPYVDGGAGYFAFMESRSDGDKTSLGGAPVLTMSGGLLISLSLFQSGSELQNDYGASQSWIDLQYKQILGLDSRKDFSSNMITLGFAIGF